MLYTYGIYVYISIYVYRIKKASKVGRFCLASLKLKNLLLKIGREISSYSPINFQMLFEFQGQYNHIDSLHEVHATLIIDELGPIQMF